MAITERRKQKKLHQKKNKRRSSGKLAPGSLTVGHRASSYSRFSIHECLAPDGLFETGLGTIVWARRTGHGSIAVSAFVVDVFCLGVKNALFHVSSERHYENTVKVRLTLSHEDQVFHNMHPACARKLIEGAVEYAGQLGFSPHRDFHNAKGIFGDVDGHACPTRFTYGRNGRPFFIRGPSESLVHARRIVNQLRAKCGEQNFDYLIGLDSILTE